MHWTERRENNNSNSKKRNYTKTNEREKIGNKYTRHNRFDLKQGVNKLNIKQLHNNTYGRIESLDHISHMEYRFGGDINIIIIFIIVCM